MLLLLTPSLNPYSVYSYSLLPVLQLFTPYTLAICSVCSSCYRSFFKLRILLLINPYTPTPYSEYFLLRKLLLLTLNTVLLLPSNTVLLLLISLYTPTPYFEYCTILLPITPHTPLLLTFNTTFPSHNSIYSYSLLRIMYYSFLLLHILLFLTSNTTTPSHNPYTPTPYFEYYYSFS